jgi:hypothetical protein
MKMLVRSLVGAAILATAPSAMALDTTRPYTVAIGTGAGVPTFSGSAFFDFDSMSFNLGAVGPTVPALGAAAIFPGSCVYSLQWLDQGVIPFGNNLAGPLAVSGQAWVAEQMVHGAGGCLMDANMPVPSILTLATGPAYPPSTGFDPFGQIVPILSLSLGETPFAEALTGAIQFDSMLANTSVFGITFT